MVQPSVLPQVLAVLYSTHVHAHRHGFCHLLVGLVAEGRGGDGRGSDADSVNRQGENLYTFGKGSIRDGNGGQERGGPESTGL